MKVAVTGASGFIGNRIVEKFYLNNFHNVVPLVHSNASLALPARFDLPWLVCDHFEVEPLSRAFAGCEVVIHAAFGTPLRKMSRAVYLAADAARVRRVVILSSASVYNQNPLPGTTEESPLPAKSATPYNANKISADKIFRRLRAGGQTEIVFLMPGVVYGPRSQWVSGLSNQIVSGSAYLINEGEGICNAVYVDNLAEAARLALDAPGVDGHAFFVSDEESVTWRDFYRPVLSALGSDFQDVHYIEPQVFTTSVKESIREMVQNTAQTKTAQRVKPLVPPRLKKIYKSILLGALTSQPEQVSVWELPGGTAPDVALDMNLLQQCTYKLPNDKAARLLRYRPIVSFAEGMERSVEWLKFAGYPVVG